MAQYIMRKKGGKVTNCHFKRAQPVNPPWDGAVSEDVESDLTHASILPFAPTWRST